jgi:hypothetical protein
MAYLLLGEVARAGGKDPCSWYRQMAAALPKVPPDTMARTYQTET